MKLNWKLLLPLGLAFWLVGKFMFRDIPVIGGAMGATFCTMGTVVFIAGIVGFVKRKREDKKQIPQTQPLHNKKEDKEQIQQPQLLHNKDKTLRNITIVGIIIAVASIVFYCAYLPIRKEYKIKQCSEEASLSSKRTLDDIMKGEDAKQFLDNERFIKCLASKGLTR